MIKSLIEHAKKEGISLEVFARTEKSNEISILNDILEKFDSSYITNYKIKAFFNNRNVTIETDHICVDDIIQTIKQVAKITDDDNQDSFATESICSEIIDDPELDYNKIAKDLLSLNSLKVKYPLLNSISLLFSHYYEKINIDNENAKLEDANYYNYFYAEIVAKDKDIVQTDFFDFVSKEYDFEKLKEKLTNKIEETINRIHSNSCKTAKYNIILKDRCTYKILNAFSSMFSADLINKKQSILVDKLGKQVFSSKITIVEDPTNVLLAGKRLFDDEGVKTQYKEIVKDGKFVSKLYNNQTALKENRKSTGNSYGVRNMYIVPGDKNEQELIEMLDEGIIITDIQGLHAGINKINGKISLQASGYYVKDSKKVKALDMIVLSTDLFELFNNIKEVGSDLNYFSRFGGAPSLLIENITVAGKE